MASPKATTAKKTNGKDPSHMEMLHANMKNAFNSFGYIGVLSLNTSALEPLCAKPPKGCSSIQDSTECANWSGCKFTGNSCAVNDKCDHLRCGLSDIGVRMSAKILPNCVRGHRANCEAEIKAVHDAFKLDEKCFVETPFKPDQLGNEPHYVQHTIPANADTIFVSPTDGQDSNSGANRSNPKRTLASAVARARSLAGTQTIVLMPGKHRLTDPLVLNENDNNLIFQGETGAIITAAQPINNVSWVLVGPNTYKADLPASLLDKIDDLSVLSMANEPMVRARHPNVREFSQSLFAHKSGIKSWAGKNSRASPYNQKSKLLRPEGIRYTSFVSASGGNCEGVFTPPTGYFCSPRADADGICKYSIGTKVKLTNKAAKAAKMSRWSNRATGYFHMLHDLKWGGWTFKMSGWRRKSSKTVVFSGGGFQEARGACKNRGDGDFFIENIRELLDFPKEYFLDLQEGAIYFQTPEPVSSPETLNNMEIGTKISRLISVEGQNENSPVRNIQFRNIVFERTYPTHMSPHETPSGGDWALHRSGALFLEHVENISVEDCVFQYLGSHAIFVSNRGRNVSILRNSFFGLDASAIMLVGDPKYFSVTPWDRTTDSDYVSGVVVRNNVFSTIGLVETQSSAVFGALTADILIERNVMYNGPRAAICYNDLFGGNHITRHNVIFNMVRLTLDHGPYNAWDRQQWILPATIFKEMNVFEENFVIASENGPKAFCADDGARDHLVKRNLLAYGYVKFKGSNMIGTENVILAFLKSRFVWCLYLCNGNDRINAMQFYNNTCYTSNRTPYGWDDPPTKNKCTAPELRTYGNKFFGVKKQFHRCGSFKKWITVMRQDQGSTFQSRDSPQNMLDASRILVDSFAL